MGEKKQKTEISIFPLSKGKRVILFLADFFLCFILSFSFFHIATYPLGKVIVNYSAKQEERSAAQKKRDSVLYGMGLLLNDPKTAQIPDNFQKNLQYTFISHLSYYIFDGVDSAKDPLQIYYVTMKNDASKLRTMLQDLDKGTNFFDFSGESFVLKDVYKEEFAASSDFDPTNELSSVGKEHYEAYQSAIFLKAYNRLLNDIYEENLTFAGISYKEEQNVVARIIALETNLIVFCVIIAYVLSVFLLLTLVPLIDKKRRTASMLFLRRQRISFRGLRLVERKQVALLLPFQLIINASFLFVVPMPVLSFVDVFSVSALVSLSAVSLVAILMSFIYMLFDGYNRTGMDRLSVTVVLSDEEMDNIYRAKGYRI